LLPLGDALECVLAAILECQAGRRPRQVGHSARHEHFAGFRQPADPRRDVHCPTVDVILFADNVPGVDAEVFSDE